MVAGGGGGSGGYNTVKGGGAGAGGLIYYPDYPVTPGGSIPVSVGVGGEGGGFLPPALVQHLILLLQDQIVVMELVNLVVMNTHNIHTQ